MARDEGLAAATAEAVTASKQVWERLAPGVINVTSELRAGMPAAESAAGFPDAVSALLGSGC